MCGPGPRPPGPDPEFLPNPLGPGGNWGPCDPVLPVGFPPFPSVQPGAPLGGNFPGFSPEIGPLVWVPTLPPLGESPGPAFFPPALGRMFAQAIRTGPWAGGHQDRPDQYQMEWKNWPNSTPGLALLPFLRVTGLNAVPLPGALGSFIVRRGCWHAAMLDQRGRTAAGLQIRWRTEHRRLTLAGDRPSAQAVFRYNSGET